MMRSRPPAPAAAPQGAEPGPRPSIVNACARQVTYRSYKLGPVAKIETRWHCRIEGATVQDISGPSAVAVLGAACEAVERAAPSAPQGGPATEEQRLAAHKAKEPDEGKAYEVCGAEGFYGTCELERGHTGKHCAPSDDLRSVKEWSAPAAAAPHGGPARSDADLVAAHLRNPEATEDAEEMRRRGLWDDLGLTHKAEALIGGERAARARLTTAALVFTDAARRDGGSAVEDAEWRLVEAARAYMAASPPHGAGPSVEERLPEHKAGKPERMLRWWRGVPEAREAVLVAHERGDLSEGQAASLLDVGRVDLRHVVDDRRNGTTTEPPGHINTVTGDYRWQGPLDLLELPLNTMVHITARELGAALDAAAERGRMAAATPPPSPPQGGPDAYAPKRYDEVEWSDERGTKRRGTYLETATCGVLAVVRTQGDQGTEERFVVRAKLLPAKRERNETR
jgi:hypothetical protein